MAGPYTRSSIMVNGRGN